MKTYTQRERRALVWLALEYAKTPKDCSCGAQRGPSHRPHSTGCRVNKESRELTLTDLAIAGIGSDEVELVKDLLHSLDLLDYLNPAAYIVLAQDPRTIQLPSHYSHPFELQRTPRGGEGAD